MLDPSQPFVPLGPHPPNVDSSSCQENAARSKEALGLTDEQLEAIMSEYC